MYLPYIEFEDYHHTTAEAVDNTINIDHNSYGIDYFAGSIHNILEAKISEGCTGLTVRLEFALHPKLHRL